VCALYHYHCTHGYRAHRAPGIPCALNSERAGINEYLAKKAFGEIAQLCLNIIASAAKQSTLSYFLAALWIASLRSQ